MGKTKKTQNVLPSTPPLPPTSARPELRGTSLASGLQGQAQRKTGGRRWPDRQEAGGQARAMAPHIRFARKEMNKLRKIKQTQTL